MDLKPELFSSPSSHNSTKRAQKMSVMIRLVSSGGRTVEQIGEKIAEREKVAVMHSAETWEEIIRFVGNFTPDWIWPDKLWLMAKENQKFSHLVYFPCFRGSRHQWFTAECLCADIYSGPESWKFINFTWEKGTRHRERMKASEQPTRVALKSNNRGSHVACRLRLVLPLNQAAALLSKQMLN